MASPKVELAVNLPRVCTIKYANYWPATKFSDQIPVKGDWDSGEQNAICWMHIAIEEQLQKLGVIGPRNIEGKYNDYTVLKPGAMVRFMYRQDGNKRLYTA